MTEDDDDPLAIYDRLPPHDPNKDDVVHEGALRPIADWDNGFISPIGGLVDRGDTWFVGFAGVYKDRPEYKHGFGGTLFPESRFYKRWFDYADLGKKGWLIIFRIWDRDSNPKHPGLYEVLPGWVPPEREREADHWITFMNQEIRARLRESGQTPRDPEPSQGGIPPPLPRAPVPVPPLHTPLTPAQMFPAGLARQRQAGTLPDRTDPPSPPKPRRG